MTAAETNEEPVTEQSPTRGPDPVVARRARSHAIRSWTLTIVLAVAVTLVVKTWLYQPYSIPSASMVPTLEVGDRVVVSKRNTEPGRGDIIVFERPPNDSASGPDAPDVLIKRVIGMPGDTVSAVDGKLYVNDKPLREAYLSEGTSTDIADPIEVPKDHFLVLGDNRQVSQDGRVFGPIHRKLIVGRAILRIWPPNRFGRL